MFENAGGDGKERGQGMTKFSQNGQDKLKLIEGFVSAVTKDLAGYPTIGYGHRVKPGEKFGVISEAAALKIMMEDVAPFEGFLNNYIQKRLTQNQFDALIIFMYNIGDTAFLNSSVFQHIKDGLFEEATIPWAKWINITVKEVDPETGGEIKKLVPVQGLINRRLKEIQLFRS
jgi:lysozyme